MWNDKHTTFYEDRSRHLSNIKVTASTILEAAVLVLFIGGTCKLRR
jgi:hypothetical protein